MALLLAGAFCAPITTWNLGGGLLLISDALFIAALVSHAFAATKQLNAMGGVPVLLVVSGAMLAMSGMITYSIGEPYSAPLNAIKMVFSLCVFPMLIASIAYTGPEQTHRLLAAWITGATFSALVAVASRHGISILGFFDAAAASGWRARGLTYHSTVLGYTSALLIPVAVYMLRAASGAMMRLLFVGALAILLYALHLSGSRAALISLLLGIAYPILRGMRLQTWFYVCFGILGIATLALLTVTLLTELAVGRLLGLSSSAFNSNTERMIYIRYSWDQFLKYPIFGTGYELLRIAHMHVLGILHCGGIFGLFTFLLWLACVIAAHFRVTTATPQPQIAAWYRGLSRVVTAGLVIWFISGALHPLLMDRNGYVLIGVLFALDSHARRRLSLSSQGGADASGERVGPASAGIPSGPSQALALRI